MFARTAPRKSRLGSGVSFLTFEKVNTTQNCPLGGGRGERRTADPRCCLFVRFTIAKQPPCWHKYTLSPIQLEALETFDEDADADEDDDASDEEDDDQHHYHPCIHLWAKVFRIRGIREIRTHDRKSNDEARDDDQTKQQQDSSQTASRQRTSKLDSSQTAKQRQTAARKQKSN